MIYLNTGKILGLVSKLAIQKLAQRLIVSVLDYHVKYLLDNQNHEKTNFWMKFQISHI